MALADKGRKIFRVAACSLLAGAVLAGAGNAQNLPAVARRDRARSKDHPARHVYTNEDFKREEILVPADQQRFEEVRSDPYRKYSRPGRTAVKRIAPGRIPLADVARHYRWLSEKDKSPSPIMVQALPHEPVLAAPEKTAPADQRERDLRQRMPVANSSKRPAELAAGSVRAKPGDSLWKLAAEYLGSGRRWREILAANPQIQHANLIEIGQQILLPGQGSSARLAKQFRVRAGDTLWKIARTELGNGMAWHCIAQANPRIADPNRIYAEQVIEIPAACGSTSSRVSNLRPEKLASALTGK
jgi:nucleoid-associated protein YgaU